VLSERLSEFREPTFEENKGGRRKIPQYLTTTKFRCKRDSLEHNGRMRMQTIERSGTLTPVSDSAQVQWDRAQTLTSILGIYQETNEPLQELVAALQNMVLFPAASEEDREFRLERAYRAALKATIMMKDVEEQLENLL
jgi:hypothetical protein